MTNKKTYRFELCAGGHLFEEFITRTNDPEKEKEHYLKQRELYFKEDVPDWDTQYYKDVDAVTYKELMELQDPGDWKLDDEPAQEGTRWLWYYSPSLNAKARRGGNWYNGRYVEHPSYIGHFLDDHKKEFVVYTSKKKEPIKIFPRFF